MLIACCALWFSGCATDVDLAPQARPLWHSLQAGPHPVGYRLLHSDGTAPDREDRVIRIAMWFPADPADTRAGMRFGDYLSVEPQPRLDAELEDFLRARDRDSLNRQYFGADAEAHQAMLMDAEIPVTPDARPSGGQFPLVLHSVGRNGNQLQHSILWEYLASHGFVVASVAQLGASLDDPVMDFDVGDLSFQLGDLRAATVALSQFDFVDSDRIGLLGHSSGAVVALWLAADVPVAAVVGLDGSNNRAENSAVLLGGLGEKTISAPFLNICRWPHPDYDDQFATRLAGPVTRIGFEKAIHFDFQNWPAYQAFAGAIEPRSTAVRPVADALTVFESSAVLTRLFLEAHLRNDASSLATFSEPDAVSRISRGLATLANTHP